MKQDVKKLWVDALRSGKYKQTAEAANRIEELEAALRAIFEVWAGSDGFIPQTAPEGYQQRLIEQMRDIARAALGAAHEHRI